MSDNRAESTCAVVRRPRWAPPTPTRLADVNVNLPVQVSRDGIPQNPSAIAALARQSLLVSLGSVPAGQNSAEASLVPQVAGIGRRPLDGVMAEISREAYHDGSLLNDAGAEALKLAGWDRLNPEGDHLVGSDGARLNIKPEELNDAKSGFQGGIWHRPLPSAPGKLNQLIVGVAGTDVKQVGDIEADIRQGIGQRDKQYEQTSKIGEAVIAVVGRNNVVFTGHSLGGGLSAKTALSVDAPAVTFNAAGNSDETLHRLGFPHVNDAREEIARNGQIRSYTVEGDPLTTLNNHGAPPQMGTGWRIAAEGSGGNRYNPFNMLRLHGGSEEHQFFVDGINSQNVKPGTLDNPYLNPMVTIAAAATGVGIPFALATAAGRGAMLNTLGAVATAVEDFKTDLGTPGKTMQGSAATRLTNFIGATAQNIGNALGTDIRKAGEQLGFTSEEAANVARTIEHRGDSIRDLLESSDSSSAPDVDIVPR